MERLRRRGDFERVFGEGRGYRCREVSVFVLDEPARGRGPGVRVAFVAGRRVGGAVVRNRVKRRLREAYRALEERVAGDADVVVVARRPAGAAGFDQLLDRLAFVLGKAGLIGDGGRCG